MKRNFAQPYLLRLAVVLLWALVLTSVTAAQTPDPIFDIQDITSIQVSPDGTRLAVVKNAATCAPDLPEKSAIEIVDIATSQIIHRITNHPCVIYAMWSPDSTKLASSGWLTVRIWDAATGNQLAEGLAVWEAGTASLSWQADSSLLAGLMTGGGVVLYDVPTGERLDGFATVADVYSVRWHPTNPNLLATLEVDEVVRFWSASGQLQASLAMPNAHLYSMDWSPDGTRFLFYTTDNTLLVVNSTSGAILHQFDFETQFSSMDWSLDGHLVYASSRSGMIRVWDANTGELVDEVVDSSLAINSVAVVPIATGEYRLFYGGTVRGQAVDSQLEEETILYNPLPENGPIVYVSKRDGNWNVYKINPDGTGDTSLTSSYTGKDWAPAWSPDGSKIAFQSLRHHSSGEIYSMNADGSSVVRLTSNTFYDDLPDYSADGSKIVFVSARTGTDDELWTMNADGTGQTLLYDSAGDDNQPTWSPDGTQIAFASNQSGNWEIWVVPSTGGTTTKLTNHSSTDRVPAWSADGSQIAWVSDRTGFDVYAMPATGGTATNISSHTAYDSYPAYSPDGTLMAFTSNRDGDHEVWKMTVAGASPVQLTFNTALEWDPDWVALTGGGEGLLSAPGVTEVAIPDNTPKPEKLNPLPAGKSEETHPDLFYVGAWVDEAGKGASGESVKTTHSIGGEVWFSFEGTEVILHFATRPDALPIEVCVDDVCQTIDLYSAKPNLSSVTLGDLKAGLHTVHIRNDSAGYLSLDAIEVPEK